MEACKKCTRNCLLIHRNNLGEVPKISSFFKVMFGKSFSEVLFLPPKFAKTVRSYVGKVMCLEDSSGQKSKVVLGKEENGSLIFRNGWSTFVTNHGIEIGDFVIFHYIAGSSEFVVQIFGRSGCEKLASSTGYCQNKRLKTTIDVDLDQTHDKFVLEPPAKMKPSPRGVSQMNNDVTHHWGESENNVKTSSGTVATKKNLHASGVSQTKDEVIRQRDESNNVRKTPSAKTGNPLNHENIAQGLNGESPTNFLDDLSFMLDRNMHFPEGDKEDGFDPLMFEIAERKQVPKQEACLLKKESSSLPSRTPTTDMTEKPVEIPQKSEFVAPTVGSLGSWDWTVVPNIPNHRSREEWWKEPGNSLPTATPEPMSSRPTTRSELTKMAGVTRMVKKEPTEFTEDFGAFVLPDTSLGVTVKSKPIDHLFDYSPEPVANVTCSVQSDNEFFLELGEPLPIRASRAAKMEKKMVILHDPAGRLWPVLYQQKYGFKVLTTGWIEFKKANNIQQGDSCTFALQNRDEGIFSVTIHHD